MTLRSLRFLCLHGESRISSKLKQWALTAVIAVITLLSKGITLAARPVIFVLKWPIRFIGAFFFYLLTRTYKWVRPLKRRVEDLFSHQQRGFRTLLTNRYVIHVLVIGLTVFVAGQNILAYENVRSESFGQNTLLYSMIGTDQFEELLEETVDDESAHSLDIPKKYAPPTAVSSFPIIEDTQDHNVGPTLLATSAAAVQPDIIKTESIQKRDAVINYTVQVGDTLSTIAQKFGVSTNTIIWENELSFYSTIRPNDSLRILPTTGIRHQVTSGQTLQAIANRYGVELDRVVEFNKLSDASDIGSGQQLIIPNGKKTVTYTRPSAPAAPRPAPTPTTTSTQLAGSPNAAQSGMIWPTDTRRITQYYHWRHKGIDIGGRGIARPLYAVTSGTISYVGWRNGYGNTVEIKLDNGYMARYAHLSKFLTKRGDRVQKGQVIGLMGTTGWSTGVHLHFELIKSGAKYNPLNLLN